MTEEHDSNPKMTMPQRIGGAGGGGASEICAGGRVTVLGGTRRLGVHGGGERRAHEAKARERSGHERRLFLEVSVVSDTAMTAFEYNIGDNIYWHYCKLLTSMFFYSLLTLSLRDSKTGI